MSIFVYDLYCYFINMLLDLMFYIFFIYKYMLNNKYFIFGVIGYNDKIVL